MAKFVNKKSLTMTLSESMNLTQIEAAKAVDLIFDQMSEALVSNGTISITGFGKFTLFERKERSGINPNTFEKVVVPKSYVPKFKASQTLKNRCNEVNRSE